VSTTTQDQSERERAIRRLRAQRNTRARVARRQERRKAAVKTGEALFVSVSEFAVLTGMSPATIYRRLADGTIKAKKVIGKRHKKGRTLINRAQLG
jgi:hypothetical protein